MRAILYVGHGTRSKKGAEEAKQFLQSVMGEVKEPIQEISFLELTEPSIEEGFRSCVEQGATSIAVVPLFLLAAGHMKHDIPDALRSLQKQYPHIAVTITEAFGVQNMILDAMTELIMDIAGLFSPNDAVLIVGRGSSDDAIHENFSSIVAGLKSRLGIENIGVCYLAAATPTFEEGLERVCQEASGSVVVVPYLLFGGLLLSEVQSAVKKKQQTGKSIVVTKALSKHAAIKEIVVERASGGGVICSH